MKIIKYAFLIFVLSHVSVVQGQTVELLGKYGASFIGGETIEFVGKDSFYFSGFYCTYGVKGKGTCEIRRDDENSTDMAGRFPLIFHHGFSCMFTPIFKGYIYVKLVRD